MAPGWNRHTVLRVWNVYSPCFLLCSLCSDWPWEAGFLHFLKDGVAPSLSPRACPVLLLSSLRLILGKVKSDPTTSIREPPRGFLSPNSQLKAPVSPAMELPPHLPEPTPFCSPSLHSSPHCCGLSVVFQIHQPCSLLCTHSHMGPSSLTAFSLLRNFFCFLWQMSSPLTMLPEESSSTFWHLPSWPVRNVFACCNLMLHIYLLIAYLCSLVHNPQARRHMPVYGVLSPQSLQQYLAHRGPSTKTERVSEQMILLPVLLAPSR